MYEEREARRLVIEACNRLVDEELIARTWGNVSARIDGDRFVITPSGKAYDGLTEDDLVAVSIKDLSYDGDIKPSSEKGAHAAAYSLRPDADFVIHTHQYYASAVAAECMDTEFSPCATYALPGTSRLKREIEKCLKEHEDKDMFLLARHGTLILGADMEDAFDKAKTLEDKCRTLVEARVPSSDVRGVASDFDVSKVNIKALPYVSVVNDPYIAECCKAGITLKSYLDDFAQIVGPDMQIVDNDAWQVERALLGYSTGRQSDILKKMPMTGALHRRGGQHSGLNSAIGRNAVLVRGVGAVVAGKTEGDAEAIETIVSKNCAAACYVRHARPLGRIDTGLQRLVYLTSYSKKMDE